MIFVPVPGFESVSVNEDGILVETDTFREIAHIPPGHLPYYSAYIPKEGTKLVHVLVAMAFHKKPEGIPDKNLQVNHKDGNKLNIHKDNLEWVTRSENRIHALQSGLAPANPVLIKDLRTGEITEHYGSNEAARWLGVDKSSMCQYLKRTDRIRKLFYVIIRKGDEWPNITKENISPKMYGLPNVLLGKNVSTGEVCIFGSITKAAELLDILPGTLYMHIKRFGERPYHGYSWKYSDDVQLNSEYLKKHKGKAPNHNIRRKQYPVIALNTKTGVETRYETGDAFCEENKTNRNTMRCAISRNKGKWKHFILRYDNSTEKLSA